MLNIQKLTGPNGEPLVGVQLVEVIDVVALLRNFKRQYPQEWRAVNYEIVAPQPTERTPVIDSPLPTDAENHASNSASQPSPIVVDAN